MLLISWHCIYVKISFMAKIYLYVISNCIVSAYFAMPRINSLTILWWMKNNNIFLTWCKPNWPLLYVQYNSHPTLKIVYLCDVILGYFRNNKLKTFDFLKIWRELSLTLLGYFAWRGLAAASKDSYGIQTNICQPQRASDIWNIASIVPPKVKVPILGSIFKMFKNEISLRFSWGRAAR